MLELLQSNKRKDRNAVNKIGWNTVAAEACHHVHGTVAHSEHAKTFLAWPSAYEMLAVHYVDCSRHSGVHCASVYRCVVTVLSVVTVLIVQISVISCECIARTPHYCTSQQMAVICTFMTVATRLL